VGFNKSDIYRGILMYQIEQKLPQLVLDNEGEDTILGFLNSIEKIDRIDYKLYYDYVVIIYDGDIEFKKNFTRVNSYNHLESMQSIGDYRKAIKFIFKGSDEIY